MQCSCRLSTEKFGAASEPRRERGTQQAMVTRSQDRSHAHSLAVAALARNRNHRATRAARASKRAQKPFIRAMSREAHTEYNDEQAASCVADHRHAVVNPVAVDHRGHESGEFENTPQFAGAVGAFYRDEPVVNRNLTAAEQRRRKAEEY